MKEINVGIIGTGYTIGIFREHIKAYENNPHTKLVGFYDIIPKRSHDWKKELGLSDVVVYETIDELLSNVSAVSICVPNNMHFETIKKSVDKNVHFICEKPLSTTFEEGKQILDYVSKNKNESLISMIGFNYRNFPAIKYMKKLITEGKIGQVFSCTQQLGGPRIANPIDVKREWRMDSEKSGLGALADFGCHMLDLSDYLLSETNGKIKTVQGFKNTFITERFGIDSNEKLPVTNDDCAVFNGVTEKGTLLSFYASRIGMPFETLQITGQGGTLLFNASNFNELGIQLKDKNGSYEGPLKFEKIPDEFMGEEGHKGLINEFVDCILNNKKPIRDLQRGLYIQGIIERINESILAEKTLEVGSDVIL